MPIRLCGIGSTKEISIRNNNANNGSLAFLEFPSDIPFNVSRIFYIYNNGKHISRGFHAHRLCSQALISLQGSIEVVVDDGNERQTYLLDNPFKALYIPPGIWAEQNYLSSNCILLALTDRKYEESDYIRDYNEFISYRDEFA